MMKNIAKDTKVQIEFLTDSRDRIFLDCFVESSEVDRLNLRFPEKGEEYLHYLNEGSAVKTFIYTYTGIWILNSMIIDAPHDGIITIEFKEEHQVIQRRKYFRMFHRTDFYVYLPSKKVLTKTIDISGGGVRFQSDEVIKQGEQYNATLVLQQPMRQIPLMGRILKKNPNKHNEYVMEFTAIIEKERENIISYCILLEREKNKKF